MKSILVVSENPDVFHSLRTCFQETYHIEKAPGTDVALNKLNRKRSDFVFIDLEILSDSYQEVIQKFLHLYPTIQIIVMSRPESIRGVITAVKAGASDYITYPIDGEEARHVIERIYDSIVVQSQLDHHRDQFWDSESLEMVQTKSPLMKAAFSKIRSVAPTKSTVLLIGETGTGKGVLAKLIHQHSNRRNGPFISVHCGAIPDSLLESELFGHEKGAFTGAVQRRLGKFEITQGGTIFLDEIGTITPSAQIKLLQVLHDGNFQRVGGEDTLVANARIIAATNSDLKKMCDEGRFRKDLYYRLNVFPIEIPPLRERPEDIPHLVKVQLNRLKRFDPKGIHDVAPKVIDAFQGYSWPGNIRELENLMERAYILETSQVLSPESFPSELFTFEISAERSAINPSPTLAEVRRRGVEKIERHYLEKVLTRCRGIMKDTAEVAGITTRQLHKLMVKYGMRKEEFK